MRLPRAAVALTAALTVFTTGCGTLSQSTVASVGSVDIAMDRLDDLMARSSAAYRLSADQLRVARTAEEVGVLDRALLDQDLTTLVSADESTDLDPAQDLAETRIPRVCAETQETADGGCDRAVVDRLFENQRAAAGEGWEDGLEELGLDEDAWQDQFDRIAVAELAGLYQSGGQPFDLAMTQVVDSLQTNLVSQLVNAEVSRQAYDALGLELAQEDVQAELDTILTQFAGSGAATDPEAEAEAILQLSGYTLDSFRDLFVSTQLRDIELQSLQDPAQVEELNAFYEGLDVDVASRFGEWDTQTRTLTPPQPLDGSGTAPAGGAGIGTP